jgi:LuxR family maltose regulon positive regulatory protein
MMHDERVDEVPILVSKLVVPRLPQGMIARPRLAERLAAGATKPVTVVAAPAGAGKTALLADWAEHGRPEHPLAWLSIDPGDDERFWPYLCRALSIQPEPGSDVRLHGHPGDPFLVTVADLLSRRTEPVLLVLDGAQHLRDHELVNGLEFLLEHAGGKLRLMIATREAPQLPLHRWRLAGDLTEINAGDLAFTSDETGQLLAQLGLRLTADAVHVLHEHTEGWAAGIRLEAASLSGGVDASYAARFLEHEVIDGHPPEFAETLAAVSIGDLLNGALIDSLTGRSDGVAVLEQLEDAGMFVVKVDQWPWTHRFHRMFGETLRARLRSSAPTQIPELHRRAARWHVANELPAQALRHALSGRDQKLAIAIVRDNWPLMILAGHSPAMTEPSAAPRGEAGAGPMLALALAADHFQADDIGSASRCLRVAERRYADISRGQQRERFTLIAAAFHMALAQAQGDTAAVTSSAAKLLAMSQNNDAGRASVLTLEGYAQLASGDTRSALDTLREAVDEAELSGIGCPRLVAQSTLALAEATHGRLGSAEKTAHRALALPACPGQPSQVHRAPALLALAIVGLQRGDPAGAQSYLVSAASACDSGLQPGLAVSIAHTMAQSLGDQGDLAGAHEALIDGYRGLERTNLPSETLAHELAVATAELHTVHGDASTARAMLSSLPEDGSAAVAVALARACLHDGDGGAAIRALPLWDDDAIGWPLPVRLDAGMLKALASQSLGERRHARDALETTLQLAEAEGFRRVFVGAGQAGRRLLVEHLDTGTAHWPLVQILIDLASELPAPDRTLQAVPAPTERLSSRELTVLRYLQGVLSNPEIAAELSLSVNTIKTHVHSIYRKLQVTARRDAVKRARDLQLL